MAKDRKVIFQCTQDLLEFGSWNTSIHHQKSLVLQNPPTHQRKSGSKEQEPAIGELFYILQITSFYTDEGKHERIF
jgi:hypothetical protein